MRNEPVRSIVSRFLRVRAMKRLPVLLVDQAIRCGRREKHLSCRQSLPRWFAGRRYAFRPHIHRGVTVNILFIATALMRKPLPGSGVVNR